MNSRKFYEENSDFSVAIARGHNDFYRAWIELLIYSK